MGKADVQGEEDERLIGLLAAAANAGRGVEEARVFVVVLSREDEGSQPARYNELVLSMNGFHDNGTRDLVERIQVREDHINHQDELAQRTGHEGRDEGGQEEGDGDNGLEQSC